MLSRRFALVCWLLLAFIPALRAQQNTANRQGTDLNRFLQDLFPVQTEGIDYQAVFDALAQLYTNPLDLNTATRDELASTYLLDERQLSALMTYRSENGDLLSVLELQAVPGFDVQTIRRLLPFVTVSSGTGLFDALPTPTDNYLIVRYERTIEEQKGFSEATPDKKGNLPTRYIGPASQWYARYRYSRPRAFSFGFTIEKDPGEMAFDWQPQTGRYGADYLSFHAQIQNKGRWRNVIIGDYQIQVGQGLVLSAGFVLGKSAETVLTTRRPTLGARPYTSLTEYGYFRGATATYALTRSLDITFLAARNQRDANTVAGKLPADEDLISSLQTSGLHRTPSERDDQGSLRETNLGAHLLFRPNGRLQIGATVLQTTFDVGIQKRDSPYNSYEFTGKQNRVLGLHGGYVWQNVNFFGEAAYSSGSRTNSGGIGAVGGAVMSLNRRLDASVVFRHYDRNFHSFYANAFSEATRNANETGLYAGLKYSIYRKLTLGGYMDVFRFPWWKYLIDAPSGGVDFLLSATYTPNRQTTFALVYHDEHKQKNDPNSKTSPKAVIGTTRRNLALTAEWQAAPGLTLRSRLQGGYFRYVGLRPSWGGAVVQDATYERGRWSATGRLALFGTDDYDSRQYVYERDVLYAFSFPAYFNQGIRHYLLVQYGATKRLDLWLRWARTDLFDQPTIGSGLDETTVPHKGEVKIQARWRF